MNLRVSPCQVKQRDTFSLCCCSTHLSFRERGHLPLTFQKKKLWFLEIKTQARSKIAHPIQSKSTAFMSFSHYFTLHMWVKGRKQISNRVLSRAHRFHVTWTPLNVKSHIKDMFGQCWILPFGDFFPNLVSTFNRVVRLSIHPSVYPRFAAKRLFENFNFQRGQTSTKSEKLKTSEY